MFICCLYTLTSDCAMCVVDQGHFYGADRKLFDPGHELEYGKAKV